MYLQPLRFCRPWALHSFFKGPVSNSVRKRHAQDSTNKNSRTFFPTSAPNEQRQDQRNHGEFEGTFFVKVRDERKKTIRPIGCPCGVDQHEKTFIEVYYEFEHGEDNKLNFRSQKV